MTSRQLDPIVLHHKDASEVHLKFFVKKNERSWQYNFHTKEKFFEA